jgi:hypothetical protein
MPASDNPSVGRGAFEQLYVVHAGTIILRPVVFDFAAEFSEFWGIAEVSASTWLPEMRERHLSPPRSREAF